MIVEGKAIAYLILISNTRILSSHLAPMRAIKSENDFIFRWDLKRRSALNLYRVLYLSNLNDWLNIQVCLSVFKWLRFWLGRLRQYFRLTIPHSENELNHSELTINLTLIIILYFDFFLINFGQKLMLI